LVLSFILFSRLFYRFSGLILLIWNSKTFLFCLNFDQSITQRTTEPDSKIAPKFNCDSLSPSILSRFCQAFHRNFTDKNSALSLSNLEIFQVLLSATFDQETALAPPAIEHE